MHAMETIFRELTKEQEEKNHANFLPNLNL